MGKWERFKTRLRPLPVEPAWQRQVDAAKRALLGTTDAAHANVAFLARLFADRRRRKADLEARVAVLNVELEALSALIVERQEGEETAAVKLSNGMTVYTKAEPYTVVVDRVKAMRWAKSEGHLYLFTLQWQGLNALVKQRISAGLASPPGTKVYMKTAARVLGLQARKGKET